MATMVTGIGFVGAYVVRDLVASGRDVVVYGRFGAQDGQGEKHPNLANLRFVMGDEAYARVRVVVGDIVDAQTIDRTIVEHGIDEVVHLAAMVAAASGADLAEAVDVNSSAPSTSSSRQFVTMSSASSSRAPSTCSGRA